MEKQLQILNKVLELFFVVQFIIHKVLMRLQ